MVLPAVGLICSLFVLDRMHPRSFEGVKRWHRFGGAGSGARGFGLASRALGALSDPAFRALRPVSWEPAKRPVSSSHRHEIAARGVREHGSTKISAVKRRKARRSASWAGGPFR